MALSQRSNSSPAGRPGLGSLPGLGKGHWSSLPGRLQAQRVSLGRWSLPGPRALKEYEQFSLEPLEGAPMKDTGRLESLGWSPEESYLLHAWPVSSTEAKKALHCNVQ